MHRGDLVQCPDAVVAAYLGSVGTVYLFAEMVRFFDRLRRVRPGAVLLFIGTHTEAGIIAAARAAGNLLVDVFHNLALFAIGGTINAKATSMTGR